MWVLASDIDNTLTGDAEALRRLSRRLQEMRQAGDLFLILSTGRRLPDILKGFDGEGLPEPDAIIAQIGTEIYLPPFAMEMAPLRSWEERLLRDFSREEALGFLQGLDGVDMQDPVFNTPLKVSVHLDRAPDPGAVVEEVHRRIEREGAEDRFRVVWSSMRDLDIIPEKAGKGNAIHYLLEEMNLDAERLVVAGDSGNDLSMFEASPAGIVVANAQPELAQLREAGRDDVYFARAERAAGVMEGLKHYGVLETVVTTEGTESTED